MIASEENLARLEDIRINNLRRAGILEGDTDPELDDIAIVWMSYGVHGNETAAPESAIPTLYYLANPANQDAQEWLKNVVVIIDPTLNPDGYSRYSHWYRRVASKHNDPAPFARSHQEPWPGGRYNHYLFDLNRDWAWQTQIETQQRMEQYNQWLPHIHADFHEQGVNSPYYFAPAAKPFHAYITEWQRDFQVTIGKNHAKYFDENGWLYFTKERFDLLYPSYGDTYPTYNGAIGMTYEQGGSGRAGRGILMENGDTLTLKERVQHHYIAGLSTVEVTADNASDVVDNFKQYFDDSRNNPPGDYKTFVIKGDNVPERMKNFTKLLDKNGIQYGKAGKTSKLNAYSYQDGSTKSISVDANDLIISAYQPRGLLTQILLEPEPFLEDSLTYDITAWSLPYAYGLETYASTQKLEPQGAYTFPTYQNKVMLGDNTYAYLASWRALENAKFLAALSKKGVKVRYAVEGFTSEGNAYPAGTLVITKADNRKMNAAFDETIKSVATAFEQEITPVKTGFSDQGSDFGSSNYVFIKIPKILIFGGESTSNQSFGQLWFYLDQVLDYPHTIIEPNQINSIPLEDYNVLIMPEGRYRMGEAAVSRLNSWVSGGGRVIAIGRASQVLASLDGFNFKRSVDEAEQSQAQRENQELRMNSRLDPYAGQYRRYANYAIPGAIFKVDLDQTHPLAFGLGEHYFTLKTG
ncbi:MAG: M14 family metallopeptidase, partial [Bacteroidota bacterium]